LRYCVDAQPLKACAQSRELENVFEGSMTPQEIAAWVQAIGSVAAIGVGIAVIYLQQWLNERAKLRTLRTLALMTMMYSVAARNRLEAADTVEQVRDVIADRKPELITLRKLFDRVDLNVVRDHVVWSQVGELWTEMNMILAEFERGIADSDNPIERRVKLNVMHMRLNIKADGLSANVYSHLRFGKPLEYAPSEQAAPPS
jgi:hypothetical protein